MPNKKMLTGSRGGLAARRPSADLSRAYEHLARIDILEGALAGPAFCDVSTLVALGLEGLAAGHDREAADLLCAAEHIGFAAQARNGYAASAMGMFEELRHGIDTEFDNLMRRADIYRQEDGGRHGTIPDLCARTLRRARSAFAEQALGPAVELARAAELLAQIAARARTREPQRLAS